MSPNATAAPAPSYVPRTVAMRKEANELRKTLKPLVEKRRRARINDSLDRLKALVLPLTGKDVSVFNMLNSDAYNTKCCMAQTLVVDLAFSLFQNQRYSKLEKADILEMTVRFLKDTQSTPSKGGFLLKFYNVKCTLW